MRKKPDLNSFYCTIYMRERDKHWWNTYLGLKSEPMKRNGEKRRKITFISSHYGRSNERKSFRNWIFFRFLFTKSNQEWVAKEFNKK